VANVMHGSRDVKRPLNNGQGDFDSCCYQMISHIRLRIGSGCQ